MQLPTQAAVRDTPLGSGNELQENLLASLGIKGIQPQRQRWAPGLNKAFYLDWQFFFLYTVQEAVTSLCPKRVQAEEFGGGMENSGQ